ncbi:MAG: hypothetical protein QOH70_2300 [Blastocatellia bacterium]|jgi:hypothetical protein|nr:hypothetical protein [Blastocatellia bacterium]
MIAAFDLFLLLALQTTELPEVKYNVAFIAAGASILGALISAVIVIANAFIARTNQSALQRQQAELTQRSQTDLAHLQSQLTLKSQNQLETVKSDLMEKTQSRLESVRAELSARNQQELELARSKLDQQAKERDARRDYEYDAHKRLYAECEPLLFQLAELSEHAYHRIYSLARTARLGDLPDWLDSDGYYLRSTMYKLICPLVIFRLIQQRLTFVDLTLDAHIANQYRLLKFLYLTFTDSFDFASIEPKIDYDPDVEGWKEKREEDQQKHWRQGLYLGILDNLIDALIAPIEAGKVRWKTYGEFEREFAEDGSEVRRQFEDFADILERFHPKTRPVLWRMLWTQTLIYKQIIESQSTSVGTSSRVGLAAISPKLPVGSLDWRTDSNEAPDDTVLIVPERVAKKYLQTRLPEVFGEPAG